MTRVSLWSKFKFHGRDLEWFKLNHPEKYKRYLISQKKKKLWKPKSVTETQEIDQ